MKKLSSSFAILIFFSVGFCYNTFAQSSTCDLTLTGTNYHGTTYYVTFEIFDGYYGIPGTSVAGPTTTPIQVYWGFNNNVTINLGVTPDATERYYVAAYVDRYYNGNYWSTGTGYSSLVDLLSSDEYYAGDIPISVTF